MAINVDDSKTDYKNLRYTKNGNPYQKFNRGKLAGTIGMGLIPVTSFIRNRSLIKDTFSQMTDAAKDLAAESGVQVDAKEIASSMKSATVIAGAATVAGYALAGLGIGALVDFIINKVRAHNADKSAETANNKTIANA